MNKSVLIILSGLILIGCSSPQTAPKQLPEHRIEKPSVHKIKISEEESNIAKNRPVWLQEALSKDPFVQFNAVRNLAITGYSQEAADVLTQVACNKYNDETTRDYAAMGLSNYSRSFPLELKDTIHQKLKKTIPDERVDTPDGIIRLLIAWGDAFFIHETFGKDMEGYPLEVEILAALPKKLASDRLWQMYIDCPKSKRDAVYSRKVAIGSALVGMKDKRGLEILIALLPLENAPSCQHRNNLFNSLVRVFGKNFGYESQNYSAELEKATPRMLEWWHENKDFISWPNEKSSLIVDKEAKKAGIPTDEYRRTHPWPPIGLRDKDY